MSKKERKLWHHFILSFDRQAYYDPQTKLETYPVWIFWAFGVCSVWSILFGI